MKEIAGVESNKFRILLVDDIPLNLILLEKMLRQYEFKIMKAKSGREALQQIEASQSTDEPIDLAVVDLMMPDIDGYQVIEYIRKGHEDDTFHIKARGKEELPIIILSGMSFNDDIKKGLAVGANQYLTKPIIMERLYAAVDEELKKKVESGNYKSAE